MKLGVYAFLDSQIGLFSVPFFQSHPAIAKRMASDLVADANTTVSKHPECFSLYLLADFDDNTGAFTPIQPMMVCTCASLVPPPVMGGALYDAIQDELSIIRKRVNEITDFESIEGGSL